MLLSTRVRVMALCVGVRTAASIRLSLGEYGGRPCSRALRPDCLIHAHTRRLPWILKLSGITCATRLSA